MRYFLLAVALSVVVGCNDSIAPSVEAPTLATLRGAPTSAAVGGRNLNLTATLTRDFMPPLPTGGPPLTASFAVWALDDQAIALDVILEAAWVINGAQVWAPVPENHPLVDPIPHTVLKFGFNGPKWPPGTLVDVVVRVRDREGKAYLIRQAERPIQAIY